MNTFSDSNTTLEFIDSKIISVTFQKKGVLSTQLFRELEALAKVQNGKYPGAYIFTIQELEDSHHFFWKVCNKVPRFAAGTIIAVVCPQLNILIAARKYIEANVHANPVSVFSEPESGLRWVRHQLAQQGSPQIWNDRSMKTGDIANALG